MKLIIWLIGIIFIIAEGIQYWWYDKRVTAIVKKCENDKKNIDSMWKARFDITEKRKNENIELLTKEKSDLLLKATELKNSLDKEFETCEQLKQERDASFEKENALREEISKLNEEIKHLNEKRKKAKAIRKAMPKRPKGRNKDEIIQYVKDFLTTAGIDYRVKNKTNGLLSVYEENFEIYCGTELYRNMNTMEKKHGLRNMVREIYKMRNELVKKELNNKKVKEKKENV